MSKIKELYKKQIELVLIPLDIVKRDYELSNEHRLSSNEKKEIIKLVLKTYGNNYDLKILNEAIDELIPYLESKN